MTLTKDPHVKMISIVMHENARPLKKRYLMTLTYDSHVKMMSIELHDNGRSLKKKDTL